LGMPGGNGDDNKKTKEPKPRTVIVRTSKMRRRTTEAFALRVLSEKMLNNLLEKNGMVKTISTTLEEEWCQLRGGRPIETFFFL